MGMINYAKYLIRTKLIQPPYFVNFILGNIACAQSDMLHLGLLIKELPGRSYWSAGGVGDYQFQTNVMALIAGWGVKPYQIYYYRYDLQKNVFTSDSSDINPLFKKIFSKLPLPVLEMLGRILYRHMG